MSSDNDDSSKSSVAETESVRPSTLVSVPASVEDDKDTSEVDKTPPLFPSARPGKKPNYGTNNTLELLERIPSQVVEMRLDDVLEAVKTVDNLCDYAKCKAKTSLMGQNCEHCHKRYCFKHGLPEVHGCGEAVKKDERTKFLHPKTAKTIRQEQELAQAKKKLQSKLKDMQVSRMQKTGGKGGSGDKATPAAGNGKRTTKR